MQKPKDKYDEAMQAYARKWMRSLDKPRYSTSISTFFLAIFIFMWSSTLTYQSGYVPLQGFGIIIFFGICIGFTIALILINIVLTKIGFSRPIRSALWFSALIGPYISIVALNNWKTPVLSHVVGVSSAVLAFMISYSLDKALIRKSKSPLDEE